MNRFATTLIVSALCALAATTATVSAATLYAPLYSSDEVAAFDVNASGGLTPLTGSPFATPSGGTQGFAFSPDGLHGVVGYLFNGGVHAFNIDGPGAIASAQDKIATQEATTQVVSPNGKFAYFPSRTGTQGVLGFSIGSNGALTALAGSPFKTGFTYWDFAVTPDGRHAFGSGGSSIARFSIGDNGALTFIADTALAGPQRLQPSPDGRFLFTISSPGGSDIVRSWAIGADGGLTSIGTPITLGGVSSKIPAIAPDGSYLYVPEANGDTLTTLRVAPDGRLSMVGTPMSIEDVASVSVAPNNRFIYAQRDGGETGLHVASIGSDGRPGIFTKVADYSPGEPERLVFRPGPAPVASFKATANNAPLTMDFDAGSSSIARATIGRYDWDFGGAVVPDGGVKPKHTFAKPGVYPVKLTAFDDSGCSVAQVYTGQSTNCQGGASAAITVNIDTPPWITSLKFKKRSFSRPTKVSYKLTETATVSFWVEKPTQGRSVGGICKKLTRKNRSAKKCTRWVRASKTFTKKPKRLSNSFTFSGKVGTKRLAPGSYRIVASAVDGAKGKSPLVSAKFRLKR